MVPTNKAFFDTLHFQDLTYVHHLSIHKNIHLYIQNMKSPKNNPSRVTNGTIF